MKKATIFVLALCLILTFSMDTTYAAKLQSRKQPSLSMQVMGKTLKDIDPPLIKSGKVYVPLRAAGEALGYKVTYNGSTRVMDLKNGSKSVRITIGSLNTVVNGKKIKIETAPFLSNGRAYVPISYIKTAFGTEAKYDASKNLVTIGAAKTDTQSQTPPKAKGIYILGKKMDEEFAPIIRNNEVMIPLRPIGENLGYNVVWNIKTQTMSLRKSGHAMAFVINKIKAVVNSKEITMDAKTIMVNGRAYIPLTFLEKQLDYEFNYNKTYNRLEVNEKKPPVVIAKVQDIQFDESGGFPQLDIIADNPMEYKFFTMENPDRMVIDIMNAVADTEFEMKNIDKEEIIRVRIGQFSTNPYVTRVVVDLKDKAKAKIAQSSDKKSVSLVYANLIQPITIAKEGYSDVVTITGSKTIDSLVTKIQEPERIVIDVQGAVLEGTEQNIETDSSVVKAVRTGQFEVGTARIVVDVNKDVYYDVRSTDNVTKVYISDMPYSFMGYDKYYNSSFVYLNPGEETEYNTSFDEESKTLRIQIKKDVEFDKDRFEINDNLLEYVQLSKEKIGEDIFTKAEFKLKEKVQYELISPPAAKLVRFKLQHVPSSAQDILVVIDPGHGGKDPGAKGIDGVTYEKNLNLDVAKKLEKKLNDLGFRTMMTRSDDTYNTLQQRTDMANQNYADFFMSIHFNAFVSRIQGIETLYYPNTGTEGYTINNKDMAGIFHQEMTSTLERPSRGIVPRPNLFVLNKTKMPSILAELGFITNNEELSQIKKEEYRDKAANALAASIVRYYREIQDIDFGFDIASIYSGNISQLQKAETDSQSTANN